MQACSDDLQTDDGSARSRLSDRVSGVNLEYRARFAEGSACLPYQSTVLHKYLTP